MRFYYNTIQYITVSHTTQGSKGTDLKLIKKITPHNELCGDSCEYGGELTLW